MEADSDTNYPDMAKKIAREIAREILREILREIVREIVRTDLIGGQNDSGARDLDVVCAL